MPVCHFHWQPHISKPLQKHHHVWVMSCACFSTLSSFFHEVFPQSLECMSACWSSFLTSCAVIKGFSFNFPCFLRLYSTVGFGKSTNFDITLLDFCFFISASLLSFSLALYSSTPPQFKWQLSIFSHMRLFSARTNV